MLLTHYKWNFQQLIGEYYETDQDTFFQLAHVENPFNIPLNEGTDEAEGCKICYSEVTPEVRKRKKIYLNFLIIINI